MSDAPQSYIPGPIQKEHREGAERADPSADLSLKQWKFVRQYAAEPNATAAAIAAGYSVKSASVQGSLLLGNLKIAKAIERELATSAARCAVTTDSVLRGLVRESTYSGPGASHAARVRALELIGKTMAMFTDQTQVLGSDGRPIDRFAPVFLQVIRNN